MPSFVLHGQRAHMQYADAHIGKKYLPIHIKINKQNLPIKAEKNLTNNGKEYLYVFSHKQKLK